MFGNAKWIAKNNSNNMLPAPLIRKGITVCKEIKSAILSACGLGYAVYYINGKTVTEDVLLTPLTKFDWTVIYNTYDVTQ